MSVGLALWNCLQIVAKVLTFSPIFVLSICLLCAAHPAFNLSSSIFRSLLPSGKVGINPQIVEQVFVICVKPFISKGTDYFLLLNKRTPVSISVSIRNLLPFGIVDTPLSYINKTMARDYLFIDFLVSSFQNPADKRIRDYRPNLRQPI